MEIQAKRTFTAGLALFLLVAGMCAQANQFRLVAAPPDCSYGCNMGAPGLIAQGFDGALYTTMPVQVSFGGNGTVVAFPPSIPATLTVPGKVNNGVLVYPPLVHQLAASGAEGKTPVSGLTLGTDGSFYGTTINGGAGFGIIFRLTFPNPATAATTNATASFTPLYQFLNSSDGAFPHAPPVQGPDGNLYGVTYNGTAAGTIYRISPNGTGFGVIAAVGFSIEAPLTVGEDGNLYGVSADGGTSGYGMIFELNLAGQLVPLYSFQGQSDGGHPHGRLLWARDGMLYGTTQMGGAASQGVIFRQNPHVVNAYSVVHPLAGAEGSNPTAGLVQGTDVNGTLYGVAAAGGANNVGTLFAVNPAGTAFSTLFTFNNATGVNPFSTLVLDTNGVLYGAAHSGGALASGAEGLEFSFNVNMPPFASVVGSTRAFPATAAFGVIGQGFTHVAGVTVGLGAANFSVVSDNYMVVYAPGGCSGPVVINEPGVSLTTPQVVSVGNATISKYQVCSPLRSLPSLPLRPLQH